MDSSAGRLGIPTHNRCLHCTYSIFRNVYRCNSKHYNPNAVSKSELRSNRDFAPVTVVCVHIAPWPNVLLVVLVQ